MSTTTLTGGQVAQLGRTLREEIESTRQALADVAPALDACRRRHTGQDLEWGEFALRELVAAADSLLARLDEVKAPASLPALRDRRASAVQALTRMIEVRASDALMVLPKAACPRVHIPEELFREWAGPAMLLERAVSTTYDVFCESPEPFSGSLLQRAYDAATEVRRAWSFHGSSCPCSDCAHAARASAKKGASVAPVVGFNGATQARPSSVPATLTSALVLAQALARSVARDLRSEDFAIASAENVIRTGRGLLSSVGLSLSVKSSKFTPLVEVKGLWALQAVYLLEHVGGDSRTIDKEWPTSLGGERPVEQIAAGATTTALRYALRDLLLLDQGDEEDADGKRPAALEGNERARKIRAAIARFPRWQQWPLEDALARALGDESALDSLDAWAKLVNPEQRAAASPDAPAGAGSSPAPSPAGLVPTTVLAPAGTAPMKPEASSGNAAGEGNGGKEGPSEPSRDSSPAAKHTPSSETAGAVGTPADVGPCPVIAAACGGVLATAVSPGSPEEATREPLQGAHAHNSCSGISAIGGRGGAAPSPESESTGAVKPEAERGNGLSPSSTHHDRERGALPASPREGEGTVSGEAAASGKSVPAASDTAAPSPSVKLTRADVCARLGNDAQVVSWADYLCRVLAPADLMGPIGSEILHRAQDRHGPDLVKAAFKAAGGEFTKGPHPRMKGTTLTCERVHVLLAQLAVASSPRDRASKDPDPIVSEAINALPPTPNPSVGF